VFWTPRRLLVCLVVMVWGLGESALTQRFESVRTLWDEGVAEALTYQGWIKALKRWGLKLVTYATKALRRDMMEQFGDRLTLFGFFPLAVDGSHFGLRWTAENKRVFGTIADDGSAPQMSVTMLWQMAVGLPWAWLVGRARTAERRQLEQMFDDMPQNTLFVMDAGFTGYGLISRIVASGRHVLLRASKGVSLLRELFDLDWVDEQTVHLWPKHAQRQGQPPLRLRLITRPGQGKSDPTCLLTSVCDPQRLSDEQAGVLYRKRWGVEVCYRSLKQTLEKQKLHSAAPAQALFEINGLLLGLMVLGMQSVQAIIASGHDPLAFSVAAAVRLVRRGLRYSGRAYAWSQLLGGALKDTYKRKSKTLRQWARKKQANGPPGPPKVRPATPAEIALARKLAG
jgi:hypothetical protein